ncbi:MAG TPA: hypothetical protein VGG25_02755 [Streptosporangiaceae bacterium]
MSWPAEIDVFLAVGELASLYVAYLDGWPGRQRVWPWATALTGLAVSVAGNIGHIEPEPGHPVILADRLTAATSPLAAFAGLAIGLLVLKMVRGQAQAGGRERPASSEPAVASATPHVALSSAPEATSSDTASSAERPTLPGTALLSDASEIYLDAAARGERLSQRALARQLRERGHRFPNDQLRQIAEATHATPAAA